MKTTPHWKEKLHTSEPTGKNKFGNPWIYQGLQRTFQEFSLETWRRYGATGADHEDIYVVRLCGEPLSYENIPETIREKL